MRPSPSRPRRLAAALLVGGLLGALPAEPRAAPADPAATSQAGTWDMALEQANRRCRMNLTRDAVGDGFAVMMPAGCRRAFPLLSGVLVWTPGEGEHILFRSGAADPVLDFGPEEGGPFLSAIAGEGDRYTLTPTDQARQAAIVATRPAEPVTPAAPAAPVPEPARAAPARSRTVGEVAGHYAVVRLRRDTGCMVTLDDHEKGPTGGSLRARLAPACGDQGIVVFDPVGWQLAHGEVVLIAKKGHTTELKPQDDGTWANAPAGGRVLVLKRL